MKGEVMRKVSKLGASLAIGGSLVLAACGSGSSSTKANSSTGGGKVTVTVWAWPQNSQMAVTAFEKSHPNITIKLDDVGSGGTEYTKLATALAAGSGAPCMAQVEFDHLPAFLAKPGLVNIAQYANAYKSAYPSWVWSQVTEGSAVYAIPQDIGPEGYAYRPSVFKQYGLTVPKTWAEFAADAVKLHKEDPKNYLTYFPNDDTVFQGLISQAGGQMFQKKGNSYKVDIDNPTTEKVISLWGNLIKEGAIPVETEGSPAFGKAVGDGEFASLLEPAWGPTYLGTYMVGSKVNQQFLMTTVPQWTASGSPVSFDSGGSSYAVTNQCSTKDRAAAVEFEGWLNTTKAGLTVSEGNGALKPGQPGAGEGLFAAATDRAVAPTFKVKVAQFAHQSPNVFTLFSQYSNTVPKGYVWSPFENYIGGVWASVMASAQTGKISWADTLSVLQKDVLTYAKQSGIAVTS
jgi:multiple sugar transport system substrate-binding protein